MLPIRPFTPGNEMAETGLIPSGVMKSRRQRGSVPETRSETGAYMKFKMTLAVAGTALALCAADAWKNPDYTQWSTDDAQKVLTKSPWAKETTVSMGTGG